MDKKHNTSPSHRSLGTQNVVLFFYYFIIFFFFPIPIRAGGKFEIYTVRIVSKKNMQNCDCKFIAYYYYSTLPTFAHFCTFIYLYFISFFSCFPSLNKFGKRHIELSFTNRSFLSSHLFC